MCEFSGKLIGWMDGELPADEAAAVQRHLEMCPECRNSIKAYERLSSEVNAYCDEALASSAHRAALRWAQVAWTAAAVAAVVALFLAWPRTRVQPLEFHAPSAVPTVSSAGMESATPAHGHSSASIYRRPASPHERNFVAPHEPRVTPQRSEDAYFLQTDEPVVQIAIPAEDMFPPGAVPQGMNFVADVAIGADGSADRVRLRPRLAGFERSSKQP
jgi:Putative zinc-finger